MANICIVYPECSQWTVTGSGSASASGDYLVAFPGAYKSTDPGIAFNIDSDAAKKATTYTIPGPAVWGGSGGGSSPAPVQSSSPDPVPTTLVTSAAPAPTTTAQPEPEPTVPACTVAKYGQCGGLTYSGCTVCAEGSTCNKSGDYYSQCM